MTIFLTFPVSTVNVKLICTCSISQKIKFHKRSYPFANSSFILIVSAFSQNIRHFLSLLLKPFLASIFCTFGFWKHFKSPMNIQFVESSSQKPHMLRKNNKVLSLSLGLVLVCPTVPTLFWLICASVVDYKLKELACPKLG